MEKYLSHITINTEHIEKSPRSAVSDEAITFCRELISNSQDKCIVIPHFEDFKITSTVEENSLICSVFEEDGELFPLVTFGVSKIDNEVFWKKLCKDANKIIPQQSAPWCAVIIHPTLSLKSSSWLGDFERCMAWAWIESY